MPFDHILMDHPPLRPCILLETCLNYFYCVMTYLKQIVGPSNDNFGSVAIQTSHIKQFIKIITLAPITRRITIFEPGNKTGKCFDTRGIIFHSKLNLLVLQILSLVFTQSNPPSPPSMINDHTLRFVFKTFPYSQPYSGPYTSFI